MSRDYKIYLEDILEAISKIFKYIRPLSYEAFITDDKTLDAVVKNLEVIGEAAKNVPQKVKSSHKNIEWKKITGLRDILVHEYFGIDVDVVWDIIKNKLLPLKQGIEKILASDK